MEIKNSLVEVNSSKNMKNKNEKKLSKFYVLLLYFFIFSFIGWGIETLYSFYELGHFTNRGFLYGPLCPIYGWGAVILIMFFSKYKNNNFKIFFYAAFIFSTFEYLVGYCMDALFCAKWWDYSNNFLNLNGRISIFYSFVWGIFSILFINYFYPFLEKIVNKILSNIPYKVQLCTLQFLCVLFIIDNFMSFASSLNL